jgi:flagellar hook assembly protein FlgD
MAIPKSLVVRPAVPNPFTHSVSLSYGLPVSAKVRVDIFDVAGRRLATLVNKEQPAGFHSVKWDGRDSNGSRVAPGIYFSRVNCSGQTAVTKMIVMQ